MDRTSRFSRLGTKLVGVSVLGLALAFVIFYLVDSVVMPWLLYSDRFAPFWQKRSENLIREYQEYVTGSGLTVQQAMEDREGRLNAIGDGSYVILTEALTSAEVPEEGDFPFRSTGSDDVSYGVTWTVPQDYSGEISFGSMEFVMELHQIRCADGVIYVSTSPSAQGIGDLGRIAGLLLSLAGFCAVVVPYIVRTLGRIGALSRETGVLMDGDLEHAICVRGRDEISGLGEDIERLRRSVLARLEGEREAVGANSRLITSLSHDIRTPLTKLTGYLDILTYKKYQTQAEHDEFLRLASEKAGQLKTLTDQLFAGAQVGAPASALERPPEAVDGTALLGQILSEQCDDLHREGFHIQLPVFEREFTLYLRTEDAVRVFDNLFGNLRKYADPAYPISIWLSDGPETVTLSVENRVRSAPDRTDSHGLGIPTMRELMERSGGSLDISEENGLYRSRLAFRKCRSGGA